MTNAPEELSKQAVIDRAHELGFEDVGFTSAEPFEDQDRILRERREDYEWLKNIGVDLFEGTDPKTVLPDARSIIVLIDSYCREAFPASLVGKFGRCYLDDDRITRDGLTKRLQAFRSFLREHGIASKAPFHVPHRLAAARAGLGDFGKNCLFYSRAVARRSSWVLPLAIVVDREFAPDEPSIGVGCPSWCRNACIAACPTGALSGPRRIDPRRCISYLTYHGSGLTPRELREPMGLWIYGCDHCQDVCPRNRAWLAQDLPMSGKVAARAADFDLVKLLHMDAAYFETRIWPHMFYMPPGERWRWQMNSARAMGNSCDPQYVPELARALRENEDERVRAMAAWALGRLGGTEAKTALENAAGDGSEMVRAEVTEALAGCSARD
jgi:epoxyqueuosine reductase